jgi:hypothetical protein
MNCAVFEMSVEIELKLDIKIRHQNITFQKHPSHLPTNVSSNHGCYVRGDFFQKGIMSGGFCPGGD